MAQGTTYVEWAFTRRGLSPMEQLVLLHLARWADMCGVSRPSVERLIKESGVSRSTIYRALSTLEGRNLVERSGNDGKTTIYILMKSHRWKGSGRSHSRIQTPSEETPSPTVTPKPHTYSYRTHRKLLQPSVEEPSGRKATKPKSQPRRNTRTVVNPRSVIHIGWGPLRDALGRRKPAQEEHAVAMPGFENRTDQRPSRRHQIDDRSHLQVVGKLPDGLSDPGERRIRPKKGQKRYHTLDPSKWNTHDLMSYFVDQTRKKNPMLVAGINRGWASKDFSNWLKDTTPPEAIKTTIDNFFADDSNFLQGDYTVWQRYRIHFVQTQQDVISSLGNDRGWDPEEAEERASVKLLEFMAAMSK